MRKPLHRPLGKGLGIYFWLFWRLFCVEVSAQQCPYIINCQSSPLFCDDSANDPKLWNFGPFTFSPSIGDADLHEAPIDLNLRFKGCNQGGISTISYILYLDLDNDGLQETVLTSGNPPSGGIVRANNAFNPGFSGGDTVLFDRRILPDSMLYRFGLEISYSGDTTTGWVRFHTDADPYNFVPVQLPEGRHRIEWRAVQDGVERFCDRNFRVKDCKPPAVSCKSGISIYLDASQMVSLPLSQVLQSVSDNITPDSQLVVSIQRMGAGTGFPLDPQGNPKDTAMFNCQNTENQYIELWAKDKVGNLEHCTALVLVYDTAGFCPFVPFPSICAQTYWNEENIRDVTYSLSWTPPNQVPNVSTLELGQYGCAQLISIPPSGPFTIKAAKEGVVLNGITTYDLVLISKHILALAPFDAGWKIAAADVNLSNSVTTFDIVELRKLILGLTNKLPNGTPSWRFFVDTCSAWGIPFYGNCPVAYTLPIQAISAYPPQLSFQGLKMGDVNGSASSIDTLRGLSETRGEPTWLDLPDLTLSAGETLDIPIRAESAGAWEGLQCALRFDPEQLEIEAVLPGNTLEIKRENWAIPENGLLNLSWSDAFARTFVSGDQLFSLRVKAHSPIRISEAIHLSDRAAIQAEAYGSEGLNHPLQLRFTPPENPVNDLSRQIFAPVPNPTKGSSSIPLRLDMPEKVSLEINDLSGKLLWSEAVYLETGAHLLEIPAAAMPESGLYIWRVFTGTMNRSGRLVRL